MLRSAIALLVAAAAVTAAVVEPVLDARLDGGRIPDGDAWACSGVTWTADGLFLPMARLSRIPRAYPMQGRDFPVPQAPYQAAVRLPATLGRSVTVTMLLCQAAVTGDQDNLFSIGRRSRWLSAQVGRDGHVIVGLDNRWRLRASPGTPAIADRRWHAVSVVVGERILAIAVDGIVEEPRMPADRAPAPPRDLPDDEPLLSFADPGSARHLHGLVARVLVHPDTLGQADLVALHRSLDPAGRPPPQAEAWLQALRTTPPPAVEGDGKPGGNDF